MNSKEVEEPNFAEDEELELTGVRRAESRRRIARSREEKSKLDDPEMRELIERAAEGYAKKMREDEKIGLSSILEDVMSAIMRKEREYFLQEVPDTPNGFYSRMLQLAIGKLNLTDNGIDVLLSKFSQFIDSRLEPCGKFVRAQFVVVQFLGTTSHLWVDFDR